MELPTREEIERVAGNANFGQSDMVEMVRWGLMKTACGWASGYTVTCMLVELKMLTPKRKTLTKYGKRCLWEWFKDGYKNI
jgi:hypothetical protein